MHQFSLELPSLILKNAEHYECKQYTNDQLLFSFQTKAEFLWLPSDCTTIFLWHDTVWHYEIMENVTAPVLFHPPATTLYGIRFSRMFYICKEDVLQEILAGMSPNSIINFKTFLLYYRRSLSRILIKRQLHPAVSKVLEVVHLYDGCVTMEEAEQESNYSERQLCRLFRTQLQCSPKEYFSMVRFLHALHNMYLEPNEGISHFIENLNYYDQAHFQKEFKKFTGQTPKQFSKTHF